MRLTQRDGNKVWFAHGRPRGFLCPRDFCDNAYECEKVKDRTCPYLRLLDKLAAYEDAEEQGRMIVLPCKVGDTVYEVVKKRVDLTGYRMEWGYETVVEAVKFRIGMTDSVGKTIFLTREEAEAALRKGGVET